MKVEHGDVEFVINSVPAQSALKSCKSPLLHPRDIPVSLHHRKVSLHGTLVFLDFSHQALVIDHVIIIF